MSDEENIEEELINPIAEDLADNAAELVSETVTESEEPVLEDSASEEMVADETTDDATDPVEVEEVDIEGAEASAESDLEEIESEESLPEEGSEESSNPEESNNPISADLVDRDDLEDTFVEEEVIADEKPEALRLDLYIEALIFAAEYALNVEEIRKVVNITFDQDFKKQHIQELIDNVRDKYEDSELAIQLRGIAGGYLFMTKPQYHRIIGDFLKLSSKKKLSKAAMETLSIIAYKQPITKSEIESIRGVNADYAVQKLLEKELVEITGRHDGPGRPLLYGTSTKFLNHFGISGAGDLPKLKEFETPEDTIGVVSEEE